MSRNYHVDQLYSDRLIRLEAVRILKHCKFERSCDPVHGGEAYLHNNETLEKAARMLVARGFGTVFQARVANGLCFKLAENR